MGQPPLMPLATVTKGLDRSLNCPGGAGLVRHNFPFADLPAFQVFDPIKTKVSQYVCLSQSLWRAAAAPGRRPWPGGPPQGRAYHRGPTQARSLRSRSLARVAPLAAEPEPLNLMGSIISPSSITGSKRHWPHNTVTDHSDRSTTGISGCPQLERALPQELTAGTVMGQAPGRRRCLGQGQGARTASVASEIPSPAWEPAGIWDPAWAPYSCPRYCMPQHHISDNKVLVLHGLEDSEDAWPGPGPSEFS